jgi:hypothetical protein
MVLASGQVGGFRNPYTRLSLTFHHTDLSVHRTRLMKESHDHLLQLCSSIDKDFLNIQVSPTKPAKRRKGDSASHSRSLVSDRYHQVPGGSITSPGSTVRKESYPAQAQLPLLPRHKMNVQNRRRFDNEVDAIVNYGP